jgi:Arc/MetJ-type ribon-helix-helix transcriptional regulator
MTTKVTVSLPDALVLAARAAVAERRAPSVSAYVAAALEAYGDEHRAAAMIDDILERTGGPMTRAEQAWVDDLLASS